MDYLTKQDLWPFFSPSCHSGFNEEKSEKNFYKVYRDLFAQLDKEEELEEQAGTTHEDAPSFGYGGSS